MPKYNEPAEKVVPKERVDKFYKKLGLNLMYFRRSIDITQEEAARKIGASVAAVRKWERGENIPAPRFLAAMAHAYNCKPEDFYRGV